MQTKNNSKKMINTVEVDTNSEEIDTAIDTGRKIFINNFESEKLAKNYLIELKHKIMDKLFLICLLFQVLILT